MFEVRIHGRGGQGVVTAAETLSVAAFLEGKDSQSFPSFGSERMGAPVMAFCRIDDRPIRSHEPVSTPDALLIQDPTLLGSASLFAGLKPDGFILINTEKPVSSLSLTGPAANLPEGHVRTVPATAIGLRCLGRPLPNTALLGAFLCLTRVMRLESLQRALREKFAGTMGDANAAAALEAYRSVASNESILEPLSRS